MKLKKMVYRRQQPDTFDGDKWTYMAIEFEVIVMAEVDGYAMVRKPRCMPFVVGIDKLYEAVEIGGKK